MRLVKRIGRNVKRRRERQGWTQAELAAKVGVHRITIARLEGGGKGPSWALLERLARVLRVKPGRLLD
jgi:transcriptional regulator with XRE-family HTH domain